MVYFLCVKKSCCAFSNTILVERPVKHDCSGFAGQYFPGVPGGFVPKMMMPVAVVADFVVVVVVVATTAVVVAEQLAGLLPVQPAAVQLVAVQPAAVQRHALDQSMLSHVWYGLQSN